MKCARMILAAMALLLWTAACGGGAAGSGADDASPAAPAATGGASGPYVPPPSSGGDTGGTTGGAAPASPSLPDDAAGGGASSGDATSPPPVGPAADYLFLAEMLFSGDRDADLVEIPELLRGWENEPVADVIGMISALVSDDELLIAMDEALRRGNAAGMPAGPEVVDAIVAMIDAARRSARAERRLALLAEGLPGSALETNVMFLNQLDDARGRVEAYAARVDAMLEGELAERLRSGPAAIMPPVAPHAAADFPTLAGMQAVDAALGSGRLFGRARAGDADAADLVAACMDARIRMLDTLGQPGSEFLRPLRDEMRARLADRAAAAAGDEVIVGAGDHGRAPSLLVTAEPAVRILLHDAADGAVVEMSDGVRIEPRASADVSDVDVRLAMDDREAALRIHVRLVGDAGEREIEIFRMSEGELELNAASDAILQSERDDDRLFLRVADDRAVRVDFRANGIEGALHFAVAGVRETQNGIRVAGRIVDESDAAVAGRRVSLRRADDPERIARGADGRLLTARTGNDGGYELDLVPAGDYALAIGRGEEAFLFAEVRVPDAGDRIDAGEIVVPADR